MPTIKSTQCINCKRLYQISLKRFNENIKNKWHFYCSKKCLSEFRNKQITVTCGNPNCNKTFQRIPNPLTKNHFCSSSCAAKINNLGKKRNPIGNVKTLIPGNKTIRKDEFSDLNNELSVKKCKNPNCKKIIPIKNIYCTNTCQQAYQRRPVEYYRNLVIKDINKFVNKNRRIPAKREMYATCRQAQNVFGSWNNAIEIAGFKPNPVLFAHKHIAKDGHKCDSFAEKIIDDWFFSKGIPHNRNVPYPTNSKLTCDFVIYDTWIEFFGLAGEMKEYNRLMKEKYKIAKSENLKFIPLYPHHLFPKSKLHEIFETFLSEIENIKSYSI